MASALQWTVSMADRVSAVAAKIGSNLNILSARFKALNASTSLPSPSMGKTGANMSGGLFGQPKTNWISDFLAKLNQISPRAAMAGAALVGMAGRASAALGKLGPVAQSVASKAGSALNSVGSVLGSLVATAAKAALALAAIGIGAGVALASYVTEIQAFKQSTMFAFAQLLGGQSQAVAGWDKVRAAAIMTGTDLMETGASFNALLAQGFDLSTVDLLFKRMADIKTLNPAANIEAMSRAIAKIKAQGNLQGDELQSLTEAGLDSKLIYEEIGKVIGKSAEEVKKLQSAGKLKSEDALKGIKNAMARQAGGKAPGEVASEAASKTLLGSVGRAKAIVQSFAADLNIDFSPVARFLGKVGEVLQGDAGKALASSIEEVFAALGTALDSVTKDDVKAFFMDLAAVIRGVATAVRFVVDAFAWFDSVGAKIDSVKASMGGVGTALGIIGGVLTATFSAVAGMFVDMVLGPILMGIRAIWGALQALGSLTGVKLPDVQIPSIAVQNATKRPTGGGEPEAQQQAPGSTASRPETPDEMIKRLTAPKPGETASPPGSTSQDQGANGNATTPAGAAAKKSEVNKTYQITISATGVDQPTLAQMIATEVKKATAEDGGADGGGD